MRPPSAADRIRPPLLTAARLLGVFLAYAGAAALGLMVRTEPEKFAVFWPPNGLLLGLLLVAAARDRVATAGAAALAGLAVNLLQGNTPAVSLGFTAVNVAGSWLVAAAWRRAWPGDDPLDSAAGVFRLLAVAVGVCAVTAVAGAAVVVVGQGADDFASAWLAFGLSDLMGVVIVTPAVLAWHGAGPGRWPGAGRVAEAAALAAATAGLSLLMFAVPYDSGPYLLSFTFPVFPLGLWAALRFGRRGATAVVLGVALVAVGFTGAGRGPFGDPAVGAGRRLLAAQVFLCVLTVSVVVLAAEFAARRRALAAVRAGEERYREVTETIEEVFWVVPADLSRVIYVSPAYEAVWGRSCAALYADPRAYWDGVHPDDRARLAAAMARAGADGLDLEYRVVRPDGTTGWVHSRGFPARDADGAVRRVVGITTDVTARRAAEDETAATIAALQQALAEIKELRGLIPMCAWCKNVRDDAGFWQRLEDYLTAHTGARTTHGICPTCLAAQMAGLEADPHPH